MKHACLVFVSTLVALAAPGTVVADPVVTPVITGLHNPRGIAFAPNGDLYVAEAGCGANQSGPLGECTVPPNASDPSVCSDVVVDGQTLRVCFGLTGSVSRVRSQQDKPERVATGFPSHSVEGPVAQRGANATGLNDVSPVQTGETYQLYAVIGLRVDPTLRTGVPFGPLFAQLVHIPRSALLPKPSFPGSKHARPAQFKAEWFSRSAIRATSTTPKHTRTAELKADWSVANIGSYEEQHNPDRSRDPDTNPYGLLAQRGSRIVADAGGNALLRVAGDGQISTLAIFSSRAQGEVTDAVPTSVVRGPDHAYYVAEMKGAPLAVGTAKIYRFDPRQTPRKEPVPRPACGTPSSLDCRVYLTGFTRIADIAFDKDGNLYVLEFQTLPMGAPGFATSGVLKRVELHGCTAAPNDCPRATLLTGLARPTSVAVGPDGAVYFTNNATSATAGEVIRFEQ